MSDQPPAGGYPPPGYGQHPGQYGPPPGPGQQPAQPGRPVYGRPPGRHGPPVPPRFEHQGLGAGTASDGPPRGSNKTPKPLLLAGAAALAVIALAALVLSLTGGSGPEEVAEDWVEAVGDQDCDRVRELSTDDLRNVAEFCSRENDELSLQVTRREVTEESDDNATIEVTIELSMADEPEEMEEEEAIMELVRVDGDWKVSDFRVGEPPPP